MIFVSIYLVNESWKCFVYIICIINYCISLYMYIIYMYNYTRVSFFMLLMKVRNVLCNMYNLCYIHNNFMLYSYVEVASAI